jgi:murein DD-endopeptidase MepM/ murein hydrolase activator NlpD
MRRALLIAAAGVLAIPGMAHAQSPATGGTVPVDSPVSVTPSAAGGSVPGGSPAASGVTGGNTAGRPFRIPPVIRSFSASPRSVVWGGVPTTLRFRVDAANLRTVRVVLSVRRRGARSARTVSLGSVRTGRTVTRRWARAGIDPGTHSLTLRVVDRRGRSLARVARATITVRVRPRPKPAPVPAPTPTPAPAPSATGVFPVQGSYSWGDGFGVDRGDHKHNGQDLAAASGTPLVSPRRGTVVATGSGGATGYYVVVKDAERDHSYVFFHLLAGSTVVTEGQSVSAGQRIGSVGSTGRSTGPHLHFELWVGGWWSGGHAIDPAPFLRGLS